ncbi:ubiquinone biosynthesis protein COQ4, putative [Eimeria brunetti]|uniref:Ubiquinone biosynthesis protein COQ4, putative n=1 Tax=Eimeria brunetti TaxID=51314 RepID=U6LTP5_9EIME|nr:ubiquinone biosynthesis protein COQ4, putative [Eimeria brunetti]
MNGKKERKGGGPPWGPLTSVLRGMGVGPPGLLEQQQGGLQQRGQQQQQQGGFRGWGVGGGGWREDEEGREVLQQRPLLDERFVNYEALRRLPKNTLGHALMHFLDSNKLHAGHRQPVRFVEDEELAYVLTRYRQMTFLAAAFGPFAAPYLRVHLPAAAADAAKVGAAAAAVAAAADKLTHAPNSCMQLLLPQQQQQQQQEAAKGAAKAAEAAEAAAAAEEPVVLYPRHVLLTEMLPWAEAAGKAMRRRVYCLLVEEWLDKPLDAFREHCGILLPPPRLHPYCV